MLDDVIKPIMAQQQEMRVNQQGGFNGFYEMKCITINASSMTSQYKLAIMCSIGKKINVRHDYLKQNQQGWTLCVLMLLLFRFHVSGYMRFSLNPYQEMWKQKWSIPEKWKRCSSKVTFVFSRWVLICFQKHEQQSETTPVLLVKQVSGNEGAQNKSSLSSLYLYSALCLQHWYYCTLHLQNDLIICVKERGNINRRRMWPVGNNKRASDHRRRTGGLASMHKNNMSDITPPQLLVSHTDHTAQFAQREGDAGSPLDTMNPSVPL